MGTGKKLHDVQRSCSLGLDLLPGVGSVLYKPCTASHLTAAGYDLDELRVDDISEDYFGLSDVYKGQRFTRDRGRTRICYRTVSFLPTAVALTCSASAKTKPSEVHKA